MTELFLKVNKDLYKLKLNANEQLILSYILELQTKNRECFISDESFSQYLNTSVKTVSRAIKSLEEKSYVIRETKNVKGGKKRYLTVDINQVNNDLTTVNLTIDKNEESTMDKMTVDNGQNDRCTMDNLSVVNGQNDLIKDNIKDNIKEKEKDKVDFFG